MDQRRVLSSRLKWRIIGRSIFVPLFVFAFLWLNYISRIAIDLDLVALIRRDRATDPRTLLLVAVLGTAVCIIWAWSQIAGNLEWAECGLVVVGRVVEVDNELDSILVPASYVFDYNGSNYSGVVMLLKNSTKTGDPINLLIDPRNPEESEHFESVFPLRRDHSNSNA